MMNTKNILKDRRASYYEMLSLVPGMTDEMEEKIRNSINRMVFEIAEKSHVSVYEVVALYSPVIEWGDIQCSNDKDCFCVNQDIIVRLKYHG